MLNPLIVLLLIVESVVSSNSLYDLILQPHDRGAACLDGSPAAMYLHEGNPNKFLIFFQGGGACGGPTQGTAL